MVDRNYWLNLYTPTSWDESKQLGYQSTGFREKQWKSLQQVRPGDYLICYLSGVSRIAGILEVVAPAYKSDKKVWSDELFPCRLDVKPIVALSIETAIPILSLKSKLSIFKNLSSANAWSSRVRSSPRRWNPEDGRIILEELLTAQKNPIERPVAATKLRYKPHKSKALGNVSIPEGDPDNDDERTKKDAVPTEHVRIQSLLAQFGSEMKLDIWIARNDKNRMVSGRKLRETPRVIEKLPLQFDEATMSTVELIDVLWLRKNSIEAAFEIECTTSIYSGLLRLSDLISMQPNLNIPLYIVAPDERREKVKSEINRATFARLTPSMNRICKFIPFSALEQAMKETRGHREYMNADYLWEKLAEDCKNSDDY